MLKDKLLEVAKSEFKKGVKETSRNRGPELAKYWTSTDYADGMEDRQPWCAAFMCWVFQMAMLGRAFTFKRPTSARVFDWIEWSKEQDASTKTIMHPDHVLEGDIVIYNFSHIGIATCDSKAGHFDAIEGNTDDEGGREGIEVGHKKNRSVSDVRAVIRLMV